MCVCVCIYIYIHIYTYITKVPGGSDSKESVWSAGEPGSIGKIREEANGNPLQCSCLGNPMDRGT